MSRADCDRLNQELALLYEGELRYKLPAAPIARQLAADAQRILPDVLPQPPQWTVFEWPASEHVDYRAYWQAVDRRTKIDWGGPYL